MLPDLVQEFSCGMGFPDLTERHPRVQGALLKPFMQKTRSSRFHGNPGSTRFLRVEFRHLELEAREILRAHVVRVDERHVLQVHEIE